jgi:hypothetical protein
MNAKGNFDVKKQKIKVKVPISRKKSVPVIKVKKEKDTIGAELNDVISRMERDVIEFKTGELDFVKSIKHADRPLSGTLTKLSKIEMSSKKSRGRKNASAIDVPREEEKLSQIKTCQFVSDGNNIIIFTRGNVFYRIKGLRRDKLTDLRVVVSVKCGPFSVTQSVNLLSERERKKFIEKIMERDVELSSENVFKKEVLVSDLEVIQAKLEEIQETETAKINTPVDSIFADRHILIPDDESKAKDALLKRDLLIETIPVETERMGVVGETVNKQLFVIAGISRLDPTPLHILCVSRPGTGKSFTQKAILNFFPQDEVLRLSRTTAQVLYYVKESLSGKIISVDELSGAIDSILSFRSLMSEYKLDLLATGIDESGNYSAQRRQIEARSSVFLSTTDISLIDAETRSRMIVVHGDESEEQTLRIKEALISLTGTSEGIKRQSEFPKITKSLRDQLSLIRGVKVLFKSNECDAMKATLSEDNSLTERRNFSGFLTIVRNIARSRMFQRRIELIGGEETVFIEKEDVELAKELSNAIVTYQYLDLSGSILKFYQEVEKYVRGKWQKWNDETNTLNPLEEVTFTAREIRDVLKYGQTSTHNYLSDLVRLDYLLKKGKNGEVATYRLVPQQVKE